MDASSRSSSSCTGRVKLCREDWRCSALPDDLFLKIFRLLPAQEIATSVALVCRSWRYFSDSGSLWKELCEGSGLRELDTRRFSTWRSLFGAVFGKKLIASPHFERIDRIDAKRLKSRVSRDFEPNCCLCPDRLYSENERHEEPHSYCYWIPVGGSRFQPGGGDGIMRECPPVDCQPCPGAPGKPVLATSCDWGIVAQNVDFFNFPRKFLDLSPPLLISVWYAGKKGTIGSFRVQVTLLDKNRKSIFSWILAMHIHNADGQVITIETYFVRFSEDLRAQPNKWREVKQVIHHYPKVQLNPIQFSRLTIHHSPGRVMTEGMRATVVMLAGTSVGKKKGFHGAKYTAVRMQFLTVAMFESGSTPANCTTTENADTRLDFSHYNEQHL